MGNPFIESFDGKARDDLPNVEAFEILLEAQVLQTSGSSTTPTDHTQSFIPIRLLRRIADTDCAADPISLWIGPG